MVGLGVSEVASALSIAEAIVRFRQRSAEPFRDVARHRGCRVAQLIAEFEIPRDGPCCSQCQYFPKQLVRKLPNNQIFVA